MENKENMGDYDTEDDKRYVTAQGVFKPDSKGWWEAIAERRAFVLKELERRLKAANATIEQLKSEAAEANEGDDEDALLIEQKDEELKAANDNYMRERHVIAKMEARIKSLEIDVKSEINLRHYADAKLKEAEARAAKARAIWLKMFPLKPLPSATRDGHFKREMARMDALLGSEPPATMPKVSRSDQAAPAYNKAAPQPIEVPITNAKEILAELERHPELRDDDGLSTMTPCEACGGTGDAPPAYPRFHRAKCPYCHGTGSAVVSWIPGKHRKPWCETCSNEHPGLLSGTPCLKCRWEPPVDHAKPPTGYKKRVALEGQGTGKR